METKELQKEKRKPKLAPPKRVRYIKSKEEMDTKLSISSIEFNEDYTRIEFNYTAPSYYENGGWIQMDPNAFIRISGSSVCYTLLKAEGITLFPRKTYFKYCGQKHRFTLYFPALPPDTLSIDVIEKEAPGTYFNFYNIRFSNWIKLDIPKSNFINS